MTETLPNIAVVIIAYNQASCIDAAIESVLAQTAFSSVSEIVVVDDASGDETAARARTHHGVRVIVLPENSGGCAAPRNTGIHATSAPLIAFLDGDDLWPAEKLEHDLRQFARNPSIGLLYSDYVAFDDKTKRTQMVHCRKYAAGERDQLRKFFVHGGPIVPSSVVVRRTVLARAGVFDPSMKFNEDSELWNRIVACAPLQHAGHAFLLKREWFGSLGSAKYLEENFRAKEEITRRMLGAHPELRRSAGQRASRMAQKYGDVLLKAGDIRGARNAFHEAMCRDSFNAKATLLYAACLAPATRPLLALLKRLRAQMLRLAR